MKRGLVVYYFVSPFDSSRLVLSDPHPGDERHLLACIEQLYAFDDGPDWFAALGVLVKAFDGHAGVVLGDVPGYVVLAEVGAGFAWLDCPLLKLDDGQHGQQLALRTEQSDGRRLIWLIHGVPEVVPRVRVASMRENLRLAIDFASKQAAKMRLTGRLRSPTAGRVAEVEARLTTLHARARDCVLLAARGYTNAQISDYLQVAPGTVARSLQEAYRHLEVTGRSDLDVAALLTQPKPESAW